MGDTQVGHLTPGEVVVPQNVLAQGDTRGQLAQGFEQAGAPMGRYEVGGPDDSINPATGMREYYYSGPGPGEMGSSPGDYFSGNTGGSDYADAGDVRAAVPSLPAAPSRSVRGGVGGGRGSAEQIGAGTGGRDYADRGGGAGADIRAAAAKPTFRQQIGKYAPKAISTLLGAMTGIPGIGALTNFAPYDDEAKALNLSQMQAGKPHHDLETGQWGMPRTGPQSLIGDFKGHAALMNPESWHAGPVPAQNYDVPGGGDMLAAGGGQQQKEAIQKIKRKRDSYQELLDALMGGQDPASLTDPFAGIG